MAATSRPETNWSPTVTRTRAVVVSLMALIALIYLLIGFQVVTVLDDPSEQTAFALVAAGAFAAGGVILFRARGRVLFALGAAIVAFVIFTYFSLASERSPQFETWGITLRVLQALLFVGLTYLAVRPPTREALTDDGTESDAYDEVAESGPSMKNIPPV